VDLQGTLKKLRKEWEAQKKLHEKFLAQGAQANGGQ
jgi:hypothetical protein